METHRVNSVLSELHELFVICKFLGIYPQELKAFMHDKTLKPSKLGTVIVLTVMSLIFGLYNLYIFHGSESETNSSQSTLTSAIGIFLTYIIVVMMMTDQLTAIRNQNKIGVVYERIRKVDERLYKEQIFGNCSTVRLIRILVALTIVFELSIIACNTIFVEDFNDWVSVLFILIFLPTLYNSLDKIWFTATLSALKKRFESINQALEELVQSYEKISMKKNFAATSKVIGLPPPGMLKANNWLKSNMEFSFEKINAPARKMLGRTRVTPICTSWNAFGNVDMPHSNMKFGSELNNINKTDEKLNNFCQIHDEICEIGKFINELWSYPILFMMAYGFLTFTSQLYFFYCNTQNQDFSSLLRVGESLWFTAIVLMYTSGKCVYLVYLSWTTSLEAKRTGIYLHKCAVAADNNKLYEIVNHLSLKLLNHSESFSASGFFSLDMETLYAVSGAITSYLIILIQFNLAAIQAKDAKLNTNQTTTT